VKLIYEKTPNIDQYTNPMNEWQQRKERGFFKRVGICDESNSRQYEHK
jgi:hypothetical protein